MSREIPQSPSILWAYWEQGFALAPEIVHIARESWELCSGISDIRLVDEASVWDYVSREDLPETFTRMSRQKQANVIRLALLAKHGGVWVDASVVITREVKAWLRLVQSPSGLFLYRTKGEDRFFTNSVIAAPPGHPFISRLLNEHVRYFSMNRHDFKSGRGDVNYVFFWIYKVLVFRPIRKIPLLNSNWSQWPLNRLPFHPFRIFHYLGNHVLRSDPDLMRDFQQMTFVSQDLLQGGKGFHNEKNWFIEVSGIDRNPTPFNKFSKGGQNPEDLAELRQKVHALALDRPTDAEDC